MKPSKTASRIIGLLITAAGGVLFALTREGGILQGAGIAQTLPFSLSMILILSGIVITVVSFLPKRQPVNTRTLTLSSLFAALCYVGFAYFNIMIPVGDSATSFHLGNVFCVLAALCMGGLWGGLAGAVGMTIGDFLNPVYITSAPKTFLLKLGIGLIAGLFAHKIFRINKEGPRKIPLWAATLLSCSAGMIFNIIADPLVGYFYKMYVLGIPQQAASMLAKIGAITTAVNAFIAVIAASLFYLALRPALKRIGYLETR